VRVCSLVQCSLIRRIYDTVQQRVRYAANGAVSLPEAKWVENLTFKASRCRTESEVGYSEQYYSQPGRYWAVGSLRSTLARRRRVRAVCRAERENLEGNKIGIRFSRN
jgi:hypothetical protein